MSPRTDTLKHYVEYEGDVICLNLIFVNGEFAVAYHNSDMWDHIDTIEDYIKEVGSTYYESLEDYKAGRSKNIMDWVEECRSRYLEFRKIGM